MDASTTLQDVAVVGERGNTMIRADGTLATLAADGALLWSNIGSGAVRSAHMNVVDEDGDRVYVLEGNGTLWEAVHSEDFSLETRLLGEPGVEELSALCTGTQHACAVNNFGEVYCWGWSNTYNQQGTGKRTMQPTRVPGFGAASGERPVRDVACGDEHTCVMTDAGRVHCWGRNDRGQTAGSGTSTDPHEVGALLFATSPAVHIEAAGQASCAQRQDGDWYCWGRNDYGQLGDGTTTDAPEPVLNIHYRALQQ